MDSGAIIRLIGAFIGVVFSIFSAVGYYVLDTGEQALKSPWAGETYQSVISVSHNISTSSSLTQHIEYIEKSFGNMFAISTSSVALQLQLPLSPSDAPEIESTDVPTISTSPTSRGVTPASSSPTTLSAPTTSVPTTPSRTQTSAQHTSPTPPVSQPVSQDLTGLASPFNTIVTNTEDAVVNILCTSQSGNLITVSTGSGVIIDPSGIILTNAHVAQDLLFTDPSKPPLKDCTIRQGHVIASLYKASVLYIPLSWAQANQGLDENTNPQGTGQGDYALLYITKSATGDSLPSSFPYISPVTTYRDPTNENVLAIGYPAEDVQGSIEAGVPEKYALTTIKTTFTLGSGSADIFQTNANDVAERGSSGGAVIDKNGDLLGLIVSVENPSASEGSEGLEAISVPYIFQNFSSAGISLSTLATNPKTAAQNFAATGVTIRNLVQ